ncbi:putative transcription factor GRAS family [Helianthus anomalus]
MSSSLGNPIQRVVYYFSKALRAKIDKEARRIGLFTGPTMNHVFDMEGTTGGSYGESNFDYQKLPFYQAGCFSGVAALVDQLSRSKRVHVIDLLIRHGIQILILMQSLASQHGFRINHLNVTAVGTGFEEKIKQTGDRLKSFAESMHLSFSFSIVIVEDMLAFIKDLLELDPREALGVYSACGLYSLIAQQDRLESLMKVIKSTKPRVMVVCEVAANLNSPNFLNRLIEALFHFGAVFDALEECEAIRSIVATEGAERAIRHVSIDVWRKFFARFGMREIGLGMSTLYQAKLVAGKFSCGSSYMFDMDGKWKGTPIECLSAWKFA